MSFGCVHEPRPRSELLIPMRGSEEQSRRLASLQVKYRFLIPMRGSENLQRPKTVLVIVSVPPVRLRQAAVVGPARIGLN